MAGPVSMTESYHLKTQDNKMKPNTTPQALRLPTWYVSSFQDFEKAIDPFPQGILIELSCCVPSPPLNWCLKPTCQTAHLL